MITLNYRHSLKTMNKVLKDSGHSVAYFMQSGKPTYTFFEYVDGKNTVCRYAYSATDAADIANKLSNKR